jgi:hypothetical protein
MVHTQSTNKIFGVKNTPQVSCRVSLPFRDLRMLDLQHRMGSRMWLQSPWELHHLRGGNLHGYDLQHKGNWKASTGKSSRFYHGTISMGFTLSNIINLMTLGLEGPEPAPKHREIYPLLITRGWLEEL